MKISCGTDIIEIERIKESIEHLQDKFINKIYTKNEIEYCESKRAQKYQHYAARFAAKEAVYKAISEYVSEYIDNEYSIIWTDIEVINTESGKPKVNLIGEIYKNIEDIDISISHCKEYAVANVVVIYK